MSLLSSFVDFMRSFIADYGVPLMVVLWTALSYGVPKKVPSDVPRRLVASLPWDSESLYHWTVVKVVKIDNVCMNIDHLHI